MSNETALLKKAIKAARKKLPILGDKALNSNLNAFGFSRADCYRQGAEEAQGEILRRLNQLRPADPTSAPK
jgi:hypothetical protein